MENEQLSTPAKIILVIVGIVIIALFASGAMKDPAMEQKEYKGSCWRQTSSASEVKEFCY